jgi:5-formyltetrahydrofolate cyclo-ligase
LSEKQALRDELGQRWAELWPASGAPERPPAFAGINRAAERLRRQPEYLRANLLAVMPDPALLQVRINALQDGKVLLAATPGLKQGLVRVTAQDVPLPLRSRDLRGGALFKAGKPLRLPGAKLGKVGLVVGAVLVVDGQGNTLGDGRGLLELFWALLARLGAAGPRTPLAVLAAPEQVLGDTLPREPCDRGADLVATPERVLRLAGAARPAPDLSALPPALARLPLVKAVLGSAVLGSAALDAQAAGPETE